MEGDDEHQDSDGKEYDIPSKGKFRDMEGADKGNGADDYGYNESSSSNELPNGQSQCTATHSRESTEYVWASITKG